MDEKHFYVYGLFTTDGTIFYIGKGSGRRYKRYHGNMKSGALKKQNHRLYCKIKSLHDSGNDFESRILFEHMTEDDAHNKEIELIAHYGKRIDNKGPLCNVTDGGDVIPSINKYEDAYGKEAKDNLIKSIVAKRLIYNEKYRQSMIPKIEELFAKGYSVNDTCKELGISRSAIGRWMKRYNTDFGFDREKLKESERNRLRQYCAHQTFSYQIINNHTGENYETDHLKNFCKTHNINYPRFSMTHQIKNYKMIAKTNIKTGEIIYF